PGQVIRQHKEWPMAKHRFVAVLYTGTGYKEDGWERPVRGRQRQSSRELDTCFFVLVDNFFLVLWVRPFRLLRPPKLRHLINSLKCKRQRLSALFPLSINSRRVGSHFPLENSHH
ncbi:MAG: hypothetical protein ACYSR4_08160, partial [Planctomycetota bacterium]